MWLWDPSISTDVAFYTIYLTVQTFSGQSPAWERIASVFVSENQRTYDHHAEIPGPGELYVYDVQAVDYAGNESQRP